jgi:hypothetical protein
MRHGLLLVPLAVAAGVAGAQNPPPKPKPAPVAAAATPKPAETRSATAADFRGTWEGKSMMGPSDSIVTTFAIIVTSDGGSWMLQLPNRDLLPMRIATIGGDSVVAEAGPYASVVRPGESVTTRMTGHLKGHMLAGTFEGHYATGAVARGKTLATRVKM